jgi:ribonuclease HI
METARPGQARRLGAGQAAVSKGLKALKIGVTRDVTLRSAAKLVDRGMDAMARVSEDKRLDKCRTRFVLLSLW